MKVLRLRLFQQTACYKKPFAFKVSETYPLPPHSTVKGMLHAILEADSFIKMKISIQGNYETMASDYQTHYFFKTKNTNEFPLTIDGLGYERELENITTMPIYMHMLFNVELLIHVQAEEEILNKLHDRITSFDIHLSLGRWEDLVRIDECELVDVTECKDEPIIKYNAYVPERAISFENHFPYKLNWKYEVINGVRVWEKLSVGYMQAGEPIENYEQLAEDTYGDILFFP